MIMADIDFTKVIRLPIKQEHIDKAVKRRNKGTAIGIENACVIAEAGKDFFNNDSFAVGIDRCWLRSTRPGFYASFMLDDNWMQITHDFDNGKDVFPTVVTLTPVG